MHSLASILFDCGVSFAVLFVSGIMVGAVGVRTTRYPAEASASELVFRRPLLARIGCLLIGIGFWTAPALTIGDSLGRTGTTGVGDYLLLWALLLAPFGALMFWLAGPEELRLDLVNHTYRRRTGWPLRPVIRSGSWDDFWGVYVGMERGKSTVYTVGIRVRWLGPGQSGKTILGRFQSVSAANHLAEEMALGLGIDRVPPPKPYQELPAPANAKIAVIKGHKRH